MTIGLDFDGVLCRVVAWPGWLIRLFGTWLFLFSPAMPGLKVARRLGGAYRLIVVSSRRSECARVSRLWLRTRRLRVAVVRCVGPGAEDKVPVLLAERADMFFDDKPRYVKAARRRGINAHLFVSWDKTMALAEPERRRQ